MLDPVEDEDQLDAMSNSKYSKRWMAPELLVGDIALGTMKCDVWSMAMTMLEVFIGERPLTHHRREVQVQNAVYAEDERPAKPRRCVWLSDSLWEHMQKCWQKMPEDRPDMAEVHQKLREADQAFEASRRESGI